MITSALFLETFLILSVYVINNVQSAQISNDVFPKSRFSLDLGGCGQVKEQCSHLHDDLAVLSCALGAGRSDKVPLACQHKIWTNQADLMDNTFLLYKLREPCQDDPTIMDCLGRQDNAMDCLLKKKPTAKNKICWKLINKIETLVFNDWQITGNFLRNCLDDIQAHTCGRVPVDPKALSQTLTLRCLQDMGQSLHPECVSEINHLNAIKYTTLELDKLIFAACDLEQKTLCSDEVPKTWLMYKCLVRHKDGNAMSKRCKDQLFYDQRSMVMNYRMSKGLVRACKEDIRKYRCRKGVVDDKDVRLAQILLCLETVSRNESTQLSSNCTTEMTDHRKMLMDDYRLSPELVQNCANDITTLCGGMETGGKTIHCLMEHARPRKKKEKRITALCQRSLEILIQEVDPGEDWRVDPILRRACKSVVDSACNEVNGGNGRVMSCLMEKLGTSVMDRECETALLQIQYFISRDFKLDPQLYKACKFDAVTRCKAKLQWADPSEHQSEKDPLILPCLYNYAYNHENELRPGCEKQVKRVMRQRAVSADLLPEIGDICMDDLANLCFENTGKGEEIKCLQDKIKDLSPKCKEIVTNFTETQSGHIELNSFININCRRHIESFCLAELQNKNGEDDVMGCLIAHKNDPNIKSDQNCHAAIEHEQLISLKNYRFTRKFKNACKSYVVRFCPNAQIKSQVVKCLSEVVRNDTISKQKNRIPKECRHQLRSQLFQQKENIDLDPELSEACKDDLLNYCRNVPHGESAALECLQTAADKLSVNCRKALFVVRKQMFADNAIDYHLITTCNDMIDLHCHNTKPSKILDCLKARQQSPDFSEKCKIVIVNRMIEQNSDYRLNINLQRSCNEDITAYCSNIIKAESDVELEGKVLNCLKEKFRESKLTVSCENELANVLKEQALNYRLDPLLARLCNAEIHTICKATDDSITNSDGQVEECLKNALINHQIVAADCAREVVHIIEETKVDIEADPILERACALDLLKYCEELEHGAGRRLKCLKIILNDSERKLDPECEKELSNRLEMYRHVAPGHVDGFKDMVTEISSSPSKKYILVVIMSIIGLIFIFGLYCGRITKRAMYVKRK